MNNKYYLATVLLVLGAFSPLYGVQNTRLHPPPPPQYLYLFSKDKSNV